MMMMTKVVVAIMMTADLLSVVFTKHHIYDE
jgi:hypothetical protein